MDTIILVFILPERRLQRMKNQKVLLIIGIVIVLCITMTVIEAQAKVIRRAIDNALYDNWNHNLTCDELPEVEVVRSVLTEQSNTVMSIQAVNPGLVGIDIDETTCPGKADLLIWYASHENRLEIERIIAGERFFGVPYRLQNR